MTVECIFCNEQCLNYCCAVCNKMSRTQKFGRLLQVLERCSKNVAYYDEIRTVVHRIRRVKVYFHPFK